MSAGEEGGEKQGRQGSAVIGTMPATPPDLIS